MEIKNLFWSCCKMAVGKGDRTSFWEDDRLVDTSFSQKFPRLFSVSLNRNISVRDAFSRGFASLRFRRAMVGVLGEQWSQLQQLLAGIVLTEEEDRLVWKLTDSGIFSVKSFYLALQIHRLVPYRFLWKIKIPLKVKTFIWLMLKKSILTRDVLLHRGGDCVVIRLQRIYNFL